MMRAGDRKQGINKHWPNLRNTLSIYYKSYHTGTMGMVSRYDLQYILRVLMRLYLGLYYC